MEQNEKVFNFDHVDLGTKDLSYQPNQPPARNCEDSLCHLLKPKIKVGKAKGSD